MWSRYYKSLSGGAEAPAAEPQARTSLPPRPGGGALDVDAKIGSLDDWRGARLAAIRSLIKEADPDVIEEVKWRKASNPLGVPIWSHAGMVCTGESYKDKVKLTFAKGASLPDPAALFNAADTGRTRRAIDISKDATIDAAAFKALVREAVRANLDATKS